MELNTVGEVIATRIFKLKNDKTVTAVIGKPKEFPEGNDYYCPYQIIGIGNEKIKRAGGVDAIQAIMLTLERIGIELYTSDEYKTGVLMWDCATEKELGLPINDTIKDELLRNIG